MRKGSVSLPLIVIALVVGGFRVTASAEEAKDSGHNIISLEPIAVTASRTEKRLSEVPASISVISRKEIEASNAKDVPTLLKATEGLYTYDSSGVGRGGRVNMRGFWGGMSTHQLVLVDGVPQNGAEDKLVDWDRIPLDNIERIEVLKGPASSLYGDNAMSGTINIITKKPTIDPKFGASFSYGSFNTQNYSSYASGSIGNVGYYFGAGKKLTDGFRRYSDYSSAYWDSKLDFSLEEGFKLCLFADYYDKAYGPHPWAITEAQIEEDRHRARPGSEEDKAEAKSFNVGATSLFVINELSEAEATFYYRYQDSGSFYTSGSSGNSTRELLEEENTLGILTKCYMQPELFGMRHSLVAGVDIEINDFDFNRYSAPFQVRGDLSNDYVVERHKIGPYLRGEASITERLKFVGGARYDLIRFDFNNHLDELDSERSEMSDISPSYGMVFNYRTNSNLYANYSKAFRSPTIGQIFTYGSSANSDLNSEEAVNYEMGMRHWLNDHIKINTSFYWIKLDNEIWYDYDLLQYKNYGQTSHKGFEAGLDFMIAENLTGFFNYAYTHATNDNGDFVGKHLTNIPLHKWGAGLSSRTSLGLKISLLLTGIGTSYVDQANDEQVAGYTTLDTKVSYEREWLTIFLALDNLLDKKYNSYGYKSSNGLNYFTPAPGRNFTIGAKIKF